MNKVKRSLDNQAIGLVPLLLFMFLDNYFSYLLSFIIGVTFCFVCIFLFQILSKDKVYQFLLLPAATTLVLYSIFLCLRLEPVLFIYSPLITEVLLVVVLVFLGFAKRTILRRIRTSQHPTYKRTLMRTTLNEFFLSPSSSRTFIHCICSLFWYTVFCPKRCRACVWSVFYTESLGSLSESF